MATIAKTQGASNTTLSATHTYNAQAVGANGGSDIIYLAIGFRTTGGASITGITVDGEAASSIRSERVDEGGGILSGAAIFTIARNSLPDPDQTDVDVVVSYSANALRSALTTFVSPDAVGTATATSTASGAAALDLSLNTDASGVALAVVYAGDEATNYTWVGLTEVDDDSLAGPNRFSTAAAGSLAGSTPLTVTATPTTGVTAIGVAASFAVADVGTIELADSDVWETGSSTTATFTMTLPAVFGADESIYVVVGARSSAGVLEGVSIEIDAEALTKVKEVTLDEGSSISSIVGIYAIKRDDLPTPAATSVTLTAEYNVTLLRAAASVYVGQATKITGHDDAFATTGDGGTLSTSLSVDIPAGGIALGGAYFGYPVAGPAASWTGLTEDTELVLAAGPNTWTSASVEDLTGSEPLSITANLNDDGEVAAVVVSFDLETGLGDPVGPDVLEFRGERVSTTGGTAATMRLPIGPKEGTNETIYVALGSRSISGFPTISSLTFDGVEGTLLMLPVQNATSGGGFTATTTCFAYGIRRNLLPDPNVEFVTLAVTYTVSSLRSAACVWIGQSLDLDPFDTASDTGGAVVDTLAASLNIPLEGATLAFYYSGDGMDTGSFTWTDIEERTNLEITGPNSFSAAMELVSGTGTSRDISVVKLLTADGVMIALSVLEREPEVIIPPGAPAVPHELFIRQGGPTQTPLLGDSWTAGDPYVIPDDTERETIQPGVNSPALKGIGWRRAMRRLRMSKGF